MAKATETSQKQCWSKWRKIIFEIQIEAQPRDFESECESESEYDSKSEFEWISLYAWARRRQLENLIKTNVCQPN